MHKILTPGYVNAQFRFAVRPSFDSRRHMQDPDLPLPWQDIVQVLVPSTADTWMRHGMSSSASSVDSTQATTCPICLSPPTAPRMTRCGHVYCYACILHYLTVAENGKGTRGVQRYVKRCPVCWDDVMARDLKSVRWIDAQSLADLHTAAFLDGRGEVGDMSDILTLRLMERPHDSVIALPRSPHWPVDTSLGLPCTQPDALAFARCVLASRSLVTSSLESDIASVQKDMSPPHASLLDELSLEFLRVAHTQLMEQWEQAQALPESVCTQCVPDEQRQGMSYFYYQAASGQNVFIHPIDIKVLLSHFGTYAAFPDTLMVAVQHAEEGTVDESLRKKCKYMAHLPMSADVTFVEIDWARTSSVLGQIQGDIPWKSWSSTLAQRRQRHHEKATKEERARIRADKDTKNTMLKSSSRGGSASDAARDTSGMSFRESAMVGAEMYFPIHPGRLADDPDVVFPSVTSHPPNHVPNDGPRTVWGTPATATMPTPSQGARDVDEAWNALEARAQDDASMPPSGTKQRPKRKPKLILTGGGRGAL